MANDLRDMEILEVSLVDEPANADARVVLVKAAYGSFKPCADCADPAKCAKAGKCAGADKAGKPVKKATSAQEGAGQAMGEGDSSTQDAAMAAIHEEYKMDIESLSKSLDDAEKKLDTLAKRAEDAESALVEANEIIKSKDDEIVALQKSAAPASEEDVLKAMDPGIRALVTKARDDAKAATEALAKMQADADEAQAIAKAREIGIGDPALIGPLLMRVRKGATTTADADALEGLMKALAAADKTSTLFKSLGASGDVSNDPEEVLKAKATEIAEAEKIDFAAAYAKALERNPSLYTAYVAKRRSA
jgi:hypothetical protein